MRIALALAFSDLRNIRRDGILLMAMLAPVLLALVLKFGLPWVNQLLWQHFAFDLNPHLLFIYSFYLLLSPLILGMLAGFLLLDDRDEGTLEYLAVTPLSREGYLVYRSSMPIIASFGLTLLGLGFMTGGTINVFKMIPVTLMASLEAPLIALFLASFASNKVEGLALSKTSGIILLAPIAGYLTRSPLGLLAGMMPTYWVSEAFLAGLTGENTWFPLLIGYTMHGMYIYWLYRRFAVGIR